jgi:hypothetical protein
MSKPSYDDKLDELEQLRYERELRAKQGQAPAKARLPPPVSATKIEYVDPDGNEHETVLDVRVLTQDEILRITQLASIYAGVDFDFLPEYGRKLCLARATCAVAWGKEVPEWLKAAMELDENISLQLYDVVNSHRSAWFRGDYRKSGTSKKPGGMVITPIKPAPAPGE